MIGKIIDKMAFDADIKTTNDTELIDYGKKYFDSDYQLVFYTVKEGKHEENYRTFITKYDTYTEQIEDTHDKLYEKYKDVVITEEAPVELDNITFGGKQYYYGDYYAAIPANEEEGVFAHTAVLTFNKNNTIIIEGVLYNYEYNGGGVLTLYSKEKNVGTVELFMNDKFIFKRVEYTFNK